MARKIRRIMAILLCILSVLLTVMPTNISYASTTVGDFLIDGDVLVKYSGNEENLTLINGVSAIGKDAFSGNKTLKKVIIPEGVRKIDFAAFEDCTGLMQVVIPSSVKEIGASAFSGCENLMYVNIPAKCESIGSGVFAKCSRLTDISLDPANTFFKCVDGVLYSADGSKLIQYFAGRTSSSYQMPSSVTDIGEYSFWGAGQLADISISSGVKEIPEYAFANCSGLINVVLPYNVQALRAYSFADCYNLTNVVLPDSVGYIDDNAFYLTDKVKINYYDSEDARQIINDAGVKPEEFTDYIEGVSGNDYDIYISGSADEKSYLSEMPYVKQESEVSQNEALPGELASAKIYGGEAFLMVPKDVVVKGYDINTAEGEDGAPVYYGNLNSGEDYTAVGNILTGYRGEQETAAVPAGIVKIGNRAFYKNGKAKEVNIPGGVSQLGDFSFARSSVKRVTLPEGLKSIGYAAFYNCNELTDINIPSTVSDIELGAFEGCKWFKDNMSEQDGNDFVVLGDGILMGYKGNASKVSVPAGVKKIGAGCFAGKDNITEVVLPQGLEAICEEAFEGCTGLDSISFPDTVTKIEDRAFKNCNLHQIVIPSGIKQIGLGAFDRVKVIDNEDDRKGAVVFLGNDLPVLSYKDTASRLSAEDLRTISFAGYDNAIVGSDVDLNKENILSPNEYGFRGQVYTIISDSSAEKGELKLVNSFSDSADNEGKVVIDPHVVISGKEYIMTGVADDAFDSYKISSANLSKAVKSVSIAGNTSDALNSKLEELSEEIKHNNTGKEEGKTSGSWKVISVDTDPSVSPDKEGAYASITDEKGDYHMVISSSPESLPVCENAFTALYGDSSGINMMPLDISLYDNKSGVKISRLSGKNVDVELPIPSMFTQATDINIGVLNDNNEMETIPSQVVNHGGNDKLKFVASHFSVFVVYTSDRKTTVLNTENEQKLSVNRQVAVFNTLNRNVGVTSVKIYIAVILFSLAAILWLWDLRKHRLEK
ncbi:MAG: leucine-rich repeat domain-containing protein [Lachnospiraceae bacterium]|nr:leucine-rich repeat domain-containing protein [Lachnospiraceae bacterium]